MARSHWIIFFLIFLSGLSIRAQQFVSTDKSVALIELYSSEGCSSCPPAERWMADLIGEKKLWTDFVPINFHVDYWNRLGWVDVYSNKQFTMRQSAYADSFRSTRVYTPQFILNGQDIGASADLKVVKAASGNISVVLKADARKSGEVIVTTDAAVSGDVYVALLGNGFISEVKAGENSGATLRHNFVALQLEKSELVKGRASFKLVSKTKMHPKSMALAVWLTNKGSLVPKQALGGMLKW